jgi:hypothetical protein
MGSRFQVTLRMVKVGVCASQKVLVQARTNHLIV